MTSLLLDSELTAEQREHVETIRQSGDALLNLVNEILDFSKMEAGKIVLENKPFSLPACVDEVINLALALTRASATKSTSSPLSSLGRPSSGLPRRFGARAAGPDQPHRQRAQIHR